MESGSFHRAAKLADLPDSGQRCVVIAETQVLLCNMDGQIYAVSNLCSHAREPLEGGAMRNGWIACPAHGARFDLATGAAKNAPAKRPIKTFPTRINDGWIEVAL